MKKEANRLAQLARQARKDSEKPKGAIPKSTAGLVANPPHGEKSDFEKVSVMLPPELRDRLTQEEARRKLERRKDYKVSAIVRDALVAYFERQKP